jgi:DNA-binding NarL/FixJ family response regulator
MATAGTAYSADVADRVVKYFYFSCLNEQLSFSASLKVLSELKSRNWLDETHRAQWILLLGKWKRKLKHLPPRVWAENMQHDGIVMPREFDIGVWASFLTTGVGSEIEAVLLSHILGFSDAEIAEGLQVTVGTVRYRVGRGLRHLGGYIES